MKPRFIFSGISLALCCASLAILVGCATDPIIQERMLIAPDTIVFRPATSDSTTISITHTCSCPFSWHDNVEPPSPWLTFPPSQSGDKSDVPISINRSLLTADTSRATIIIVSNSYGNDSIFVTAIK